MRYAFKDKYTDYQGTDVERAFNTRFYAYAGTGAAATRQNPARSNGTIAATNGQNQTIILGGGYHKFSVGTTSAPVNQNNTMFRIIGHGMKNSIVDAILYVGHLMSSGSFDGVFLKDVTVKNVVTYRLGYNGQGTYYNKYYQCEILALPTLANVGVNITNLYDRCIFRVNPSGTINANNSFIGAVISTIPTTHQQLFENCDIYLPDATLLDSRTPYYFAFDRCRFRIIGETGYTELTGSTPEELRANFVARCVAQGYNPPDNTEFGITNKFYRWVFTKNSCFESNIPAGSDIHNFEKPRSILFGAISARVGRVPVAVSSTASATINAGAPTSGNMSFREDGLRLLDNIDISDKHSFTAGSNIIWLGGKRKLSYLDIIDNFQKAYGLQADSTPDLLLDNGILPGTEQIKEGVFYVLRSEDKQLATAKYNGNVYSTSLAERNNLIRGVPIETTFTGLTGMPVLYEVWDELQYRTIQMRIVNKIPSDIIRPANTLLEGYWYFVEHDTDQSNTTDYVTWQGRNYPVLSSFYIFPGLATSFTASGNVHLRRCWQEDFDLNRSVDKTFWENEQKPKWFDVTEKDVRCLLMNNNELSVEMQTDADGNYIASGHPEFYHAITGETGILLKPMLIKGTYMQIRIVASTLNTM